MQAWNDVMPAQPPTNTYPYRADTYPFTNISFVTSLEEALIRTTQFSSEMVYFHQDKNEFYRVRVDNAGRKSYLICQYNLPQANAGETDFASLERRIAALEALLRPTEEVRENAKSDG